MTDYSLTAGQQQQIIGFLNAGKSIYLGGNDFGYYHGTAAVYKMFGCNYLGDSDTVANLTGQRSTLCDNVNIAYYNHANTNAYVDWISSDGGEILFKSEEGFGRTVAYAGPNGTYRAIHCSYIFGAMIDNGSTYTKSEIMAAYMRYLMGDDLVLPVACNISAATGGQVCLGLEAPVSEAGRMYGVLGSQTGTSPGFHLGFVDVPLNQDSFFQMVLMFWNSPVFNNFLGTLDAQGRAIATLDTLGPLDPSWVGIQMHFAYILSNYIDYASMPVEVNIVP